MTRLSSALLAAVVSAGLTFALLRPIGAQRSREANALSRENSRLRQALWTKPSPSSRLDALSTRIRERQPTRGSETATPTPDPNGHTGSYRNDGQSTPEGTLQTFAWAADRGDAETLAKLVCFEPGARRAAENLMATLPDSVRRGFDSAEEFIAFVVTAETMYRPFPGAEILDKATRTRVSDDRVVLHLPGTLRENTPYLRTDRGWMVVIDESAVARFATEIAEYVAGR